MDISPFFFYLFAVGAIAASLNVVFRRNPVTSAFSLVLVFFCFAAIYAMMQAHLIAAIQVMVYAGAVMVLFIFVIMLLNADKPDPDFGEAKLGTKLFAGIIALCLLGGFIVVFKNSSLVEQKGAFSPEAIEAAGGNTRVIAELMFSEYIFPFELTSVLLLGAIVGAVAIAMRNKEGGQRNG